MANCTDFIEAENFRGIEETPRELLNVMELKKNAIIALIGKEKYDEELAVMKTLAENEAKKGIFETLDGDIDRRGKDLKDIQLSNGFNIHCVLKGGKLSGG